MPIKIKFLHVKKQVKNQINEYIERSRTLFQKRTTSLKQISQAMSAKNVIQKLEDCDLIRLFLDFVQHHHLQYEKTSKEISYKCYEATWILVNFKANGYGRTESQAYKHALRNLLQILIEEPMYTEFFIESLATIHNSNFNPLKKQSSSDQNQNYLKKIINSKTQGHEPTEKQMRNREESKSKIYESSSKINQRSQAKFITKDWEKPATKLIESNNVYQTSKLQNQKKFSQNFSLTTKNNHNAQLSEELRKALKKLTELQNYLTSVTKQNEELKNQLKQLDERQTLEDEGNIQFCAETEYVQKIEVLNDAQYVGISKNKPLIPKLKLQILPNYHKKAEKSLNESLMAAYNEKRDQSLKKLVC